MKVLHGFRDKREKALEIYAKNKDRFYKGYADAMECAEEIYKDVEIERGRIEAENNNDVQLMINFIRSFVEIADKQKLFPPSVTVYDSNYAKVRLRSVTIQIAQEGIENLRKMIKEQVNEKD